MQVSDWIMLACGLSMLVILGGELAMSMVNRIIERRKFLKFANERLVEIYQKKADEMGKIFYNRIMGDNFYSPIGFDGEACSTQILCEACSVRVEGELQKLQPQEWRTCTECGYKHRELDAKGEALISLANAGRM